MIGRRKHEEPEIVLADAPAPEGGTPHVLTVPGEVVPLYSVGLPSGVKGRARLRIAEAALSDRLGFPAGSARLIPAPLGGAGVWDRVLMMGTPQELPSGQAGCRAMLPDYLTLPAAADLVVIQRFGPRVCVRIGTRDGFAAPLSLAPVLLEAALREAGGEITGAWTTEPLPDGFAEVLAAADIALVDTEQGPGQAPRRFAHGELALDLRPEQDSGDGVTVGLWAAAVCLLLLAFVIWAGKLAMDTRSLQQAALAAEDRTIARLREGLLPEGPILDIRQQVIRLMETDQGSAALPQRQNAVLDLLARISVAFSSQDLRPTRLQIGPGPVASIDVTAPSFARIEALNNGLMGYGLIGESEELRTRDGVVEARLRLGLLISEAIMQEQK